MMHRVAAYSTLLLAALALPACRGAETADLAREPGRSDPMMAPAPPAAAAPAAMEVEAPAPAPAEVPATPAAEAPGAAQPAAPAATQRPARSGAESAPAAPAESAPQAEQILRRAEQAYRNVRSMEADFVQSLSVPLLGSNQQSRGNFYQRRPDRLLLRFTDPAGDILVADGQYFWMYYPSSDRTQVLRSRMTQGGGQVDLHQEFLSNPTERFVATLVGEERVDGRPAQVLTLVPKGRSGYKLVKVWVDRGDSLVRRFEITEENDSVRRLELRNLKLNQNLPGSLFQFTPPAGTQVFDQ
ncbi:hypothetical protein BH23GEM7_BH23GEM7_02200 [soil metagenome]